MDQTTFTAEAYAPRAADYVTSAVHSAGPDLDQMAAALAGHADACVLDLGCGGGHVSYRVAPLVRRVIAVDPAPAMLDAVRRTAAARGLANITAEQAASEALPFPAATFDAVLCRFTCHHWPSVPAGLREARRVLRPAGLAVFVDSVAPDDPVLDTHIQAMELLRDPSHARNYTCAEWLTMLAAAGFGGVEVTMRKLRLEFATWIARTRTPDATAQAIRALQQAAPPAVRDHFAIAGDGSFDLDVATFSTRAG